MAGIDGAAIKSARLKQGLSQAELARKIGTTAPSVSNWEMNKNQPTSKFQEKLVRVLGVSSSSDTGADESEGLPAFSMWLSRVRTGRDMTVAELAEASGVSSPAIYNIEAGRSANPQSSTREKLERALGSDVPKEVEKESKADSRIEGIGELQSFDPYDSSDRPAKPGIYVFYDVSDRPIYVGEGANIAKRVGDHEEKFWFKRPIVENGSFLVVKNAPVRRQIEKALIKFLKSNAVINKQYVERL